MSETLLHNQPEQEPAIVSYDQKEYANGVKHLYGIDEAGKEHHLSYEAVARQNGYELPEEGDTTNPFLYKLRHGGELALRPGAHASAAEKTEIGEPETSATEGPRTNPYLYKLKNGGSIAEEKRLRADAKDEHATLADKAARGVKKTEAIASKRRAREHYLDWKADADSMRTERAERDKKSWQARMGIIDESEAPTEEPSVYHVARDEKAEQQQSEYAQLLRAANKEQLQAAANRDTEPTGPDSHDSMETDAQADSAKEEREKAAIAAAQADSDFFTSDERKASLERMNSLRARRDIRKEEKALEAEERAIEAQLAAQQSQTLRGRLKRVKEAIGGNINLAVGNVFLAVGNRLRNADQYQEHVNKRRGAIALGVGAVALAAIGYATYKGLLDGSEGSLADPSDILSGGSDAYDLADPSDILSGEEANGTEPTEGSGADVEPGGEADGGNGGEQDIDPESEAGAEAGGDGNGDEPSPETGDDEDLSTQTEVLQVDQGDGFISTIRDQYGLDIHEAEQAYEAIKEHLIGAEGTYSHGSDIRIADAGTFELPASAQAALEEYLQNAGKL